MKRTYAKPVMTVERFLANVAVAACQPSTEIQPVRVDCFIKSGAQDGVFYSGGCGYVASENNLVTIEEKQYLYWYGEPDGTPEAGGKYPEGHQYAGYYYGQALMDQLTALHISQNGTDGVLHAGPATPAVLSVINSST